MNDHESKKRTVKKLAIPALSALVVGSMIGGGIFSLPSQMARAAAPLPMIIGWIVSGLGMLTLAFCFQSLATRFPEIDGGPYGYAKHGFGNYIGFCSAIGYWIGAWIGNVAFLVLFMSSLGTFFPIFEGGNGTASIIVASLILWVVHFLVLRGVTEAAGMNVIVTIAKIIPLATFVIIGCWYFKLDIFTADLWGTATQVTQDGAQSATPLGSTLSQIMALMLITVWVFSGVEGASIFSERAKKRSDVGKATVIGYLFVLGLLILVNVLSYGVVPQSELSKLKDPSLGGVFAHLVGPWGAKFVSIGLMISLIGVFLSWVLLSTEILRIPALEGIVPTRIGQLNPQGTPTVALWMTNICVQVLLITTLFSEKTYQFLILLASGVILIPYMWVAFFQLKSVFCPTEQTNSRKPTRPLDLMIGLLGSAYSLWLIYAGGLVYLLGSMTAYLCLTGLFVVARRQAGDQKVFRPYEIGVLLVLFAGTIWFFIGLANGTFSF